MAKLTAAKRRKMPKGGFAGPGKSFPVSDPTHARLAISGATRSYNAGNISKSTEAHVKAKARAELGEKRMARGGIVDDRKGHPHKNLGKYLHPKKGANRYEVHSVLDRKDME